MIPSVFQSQLCHSTTVQHCANGLWLSSLSDRASGAVRVKTVHPNSGDASVLVKFRLHDRK